MMIYDGGWGWWQMALGWIGMLVFWGALIWVVLVLVGRVPRWQDDSTRHGADARRILDERLARGEIDADEYKRIRDLLSEHDRSRMG